MSTQQDLPDIRMSVESLYREELFTDRRVGSVRKLIPVRADGSDDSGRKVTFEGQTSVLTSAGPLPLHFEIEADTLAEAIERFPATAQRALAHTLEELEEIRREATSSLIVPGRPGIGNIKRP
jgi:hypothetical protein